MTLLDRVKSLAKSKKVSLSELERKLDFSNGSMSKWSTQSPSGERLQKVADYFNVSTDYLLGRTDEPYWALTEKDERSIQDELERLIDDLDGLKYSKDTAEFDDETRELIIASLEQAVRIAKMEAKRKFTPKKYRNGE